MKHNEKTVERYLKLKELRKRFGITQTEISKLIGCSACNYNGKENGRYNFSLMECRIIQKFFNELLKENDNTYISLDELFFATECNI